MPSGVWMIATAGNETPHAVALEGDAPAERMVTVVYLAKLLSKSPDTIYRLARPGSIPGFKVGGEWRFFESRVLEHLSRPPEPWAQSERSRRARRITD